MHRQISAGGIVVNSQNQVLLVENSSIKDEFVTYWGFPKGHIEGQESSKETAIREVKEETGINAEIIKKVGESKYIFKRNGEDIFKIVIIFLMKYREGEVVYQKSELSQAGWYSFEEALKLLSFTKDKELLKKAIEFL